jgi:hypothetical protein
VATLEELEARVAALEASHADYRAVLAAVNVLGANQREIAITLADHTRDLAELKGGQAELRTGWRSLEENVAEIKDLLVRALDR